MKINQKVNQLIQLCVNIVLILTIFGLKEQNEDFYLPNYLVWIPFVCWGILIIGLVLEYLSGYKPIVRTILLSFTVVFSLICLSDSFNLFVDTLIILGIPYIIALIVLTIKNGFAANSTNESMIKFKNCLPLGIFAKKDLIIQYISFGIFFVIIALLAVFIPKEGNYLLIIISVAIISICIIFLISYNTNTLQKILNAINKDLNYAKFDTLLTKTLKNNLHPESYNYLNIVKANYSSLVSIEEAVAIFEKTTMPTQKKYKSFYQIVEVEILMETGKFDEAKAKIDALPNNYKANLLNLYKVLATDEEILNIESLYPINNRIKINNMLSLYVRMIYFEMRDKHDDAKRYAHAILNLNTDFKRYNEDAQAICDDKFKIEVK